MLLNDLKNLVGGSGEPTCELLGPVSLALQAFLGLIAILFLAVKRLHEHPRRPWRIWLFDVSKQVLGALFIHFVNVLASIAISGDDTPGMDDNPCTWYFLNVLFDTTIGVPILWFALWWVYDIAYRLKVQDILSGEYGDPPRTRAFVKQLVLYLVAQTLAKIILAVVLYTVPFLDDFGAFLISWTAFDARVEIVFVMLLFPTVMNSIQYYVVDSIIQSPNFGIAAKATNASNRSTVRWYAATDVSKHTRQPSSLRSVRGDY